MIRGLLIASIAVALFALAGIVRVLQGRHANAQTRGVAKATLVLLIGLLISTVPHVLWPAAGSLHLATSLISACFTVGSMFLLWKANRSAKSPT